MHWNHQRGPGVCLCRTEWGGGRECGQPTRGTSQAWGTDEWLGKQGRKEDLRHCYRLLGRSSKHATVGNGAYCEQGAGLWGSLWMGPRDGPHMRIAGQLLSEFTFFPLNRKGGIVMVC